MGAPHHFTVWCLLATHPLSFPFIQTCQVSPSSLTQGEHGTALQAYQLWSQLITPIVWREERVRRVTQEVSWYPRLLFRS